MLGRWVHPGSGRSYHEKFAPAKMQGIDDITGEPLVKRKDDNIDTLTKRLNIYTNQTSPVTSSIPFQHLKAFSVAARLLSRQSHTYRSREAADRRG